MNAIPLQKIIEEIQDKLFDKLTGTGWEIQLRFFIKSSDMSEILLFLHFQKEENKRFTPVLNDIFRPFQLCPCHDLKVVFVADKPPQNPLLNNGLAISHKGSITEQHEFNAFYEELKQTVGNNNLINADLSGWAKQGILLLNTSLTTRIGHNVVGSHAVVWKPLINALFDILNRKQGLIWVFFGESDYFDLVEDESSIKIVVPPLPDKRDVIWKSGDVFNTINKHLSDKKIINIVW